MRPSVSSISPRPQSSISFPSCADLSNPNVSDLLAEVKSVVDVRPLTKAQLIVDLRSRNPGDKSGCSCLGQVRLVKRQWLDRSVMFLGNPYRYEVLLMYIGGIIGIGISQERNLNRAADSDACLTVFRRMSRTNLALSPLETPVEDMVGFRPGRKENTAGVSTLSYTYSRATSSTEIPSNRSQTMPPSTAYNSHSDP